MPDAVHVDPLARALFPALVHRVANATQLLTGLRSMLELPGGDDHFAARAGDLADTSERFRRLGYVLGVLGSAQGADLLQVRRDAEGLAHVLDLVVEAMRREGRVVEVEGDAPALATGALDGWQVPWAVGALVVAGAGELDEGATALVRWSRDGTGAAGLDGPGGAGVRELAPLVGARLPGAELDAAGERFALRLPAAWLEPVRTGCG